MADTDSVPISINLKLPEYTFQLQDDELSNLHESAKKALWEGIEKDGELRIPLTTRPKQTADKRRLSLSFE